MLIRRFADADELRRFAQSTTETTATQLASALTVLASNLFASLPNATAAAPVVVQALAIARVALAVAADLRKALEPLVLLPMSAAPGAPAILPLSATASRRVLRRPKIISEHEKRLVALKVWVAAKFFVVFFHRQLLQDGLRECCGQIFAKWAAWLAMTRAELFNKSLCACNWRHIAGAKLVRWGYFSFVWPVASLPTNLRFFFLIPPSYTHTHTHTNTYTHIHTQIWHAHKFEEETETGSAVQSVILVPCQVLSQSKRS
jgi:hypothetical protein